MPNSTNKFLTMKQAPPRISFGYWQQCSRKQYDEDLKMTVIWDPNGTIRIQYDTGVREIYYPKPSISDILKRAHSGEYFRVHKNGSVEHGYDKEYYYWGPDEEVEWTMSNIELSSVDECCCSYCRDTVVYYEEESPKNACYCEYCL